MVRQSGNGRPRGHGAAGSRGINSRFFFLILVAIVILLAFKQWQQDVAQEHFQQKARQKVLLDLLHKVGASSTARECHHVEQHSDFHGDVVVDGSNHLKDTAADCCEACRAHAQCSAWVWCGGPWGCGAGRQHKECWLKRAHLKEHFEIDVGNENTTEFAWTSGLVYTQKEFKEYQRLAAAQEREHQAWLAAKVANPDLPLVWMDVAIHGKPAGRIEFVLFSDVAPLAAESMRRLCTGESGTAPKGQEGEGLPYSLQGAFFYRIIHKFIDQTGAQTGSPLGGDFKDEPGALALKHDRKGLLSLANSGPNTNCAHFSIVMNPAPHLNGNYGIFGAVTKGMEVAEAINALSKGSYPNLELLDSQAAQITAVGQYRQGKPFDTSLLEGNVKKIG